MSFFKLSAVSLALCFAASGTLAIAQVKVDANSALKKYTDKYLSQVSKKGVPAPKPDRASAQKLIDKGWLEFKNKLDYEAAYNHFFQAIKADRSYAPGYFGVAYLSSCKNQLEDAIIFYREALRYEKKFGPIYCNLATALNLQNKDNMEIPILLQQSILNCPKFTDAYLIYADYLAGKEQWAKAGEIVNQGIKNGAKVKAEFREEFKKHGITISE